MYRQAGRMYRHWSLVQASPRRHPSVTQPECTVTWAECTVTWACLSVAHHQPAVDDHCLARHVVRVATRQEADDARHVVGRFGATERDEAGASPPGLAELQSLELGPFGVQLGP